MAQIMTQAVRDAHKTVLADILECISGYEDLDGDVVYPGTDIAYIKDFIQRAIRAADDLPIDKLGRWTGYIQGVLIARGILNVNMERDRTRPIFHGAYGY